MAASGSKTLPSIGFFTVTEDAETGFVGGLLVINGAGRPLEFHCTAPLKPNRAQQILYGPTLRPFLYGEQIGATLAAKAKSDTLFLCTDVEPAMCLRDSIQTPLLLVFTASECTGQADFEAKNQVNLRLDPAQPLAGPTIRVTPFSLGRHSVAVAEQHLSDRELVEQRWQPYCEQLDLREPFHRIREALHEAQRGVAK
jgi:hypothetical protein